MSDVRIEFPGLMLMGLVNLREAEETKMSASFIIWYSRAIPEVTAE